MKNLANNIGACAARNEGVFMPFLVIGDPDFETSLGLVDALVEAGADVLEFGLPFSDPPADGPVIQAADTRALRAGMTTERAFEWLAAVHTRHPQLPIALLVYYNLILQHGVDRFYSRASACGVEAILVADVPLELARPCLDAAKHSSIAPIFIATELTTDSRLRAIAEVADGYVYAVARLGVTGEQRELDDGLREQIARFRRGIPLPCLVGFGISTPEQAREVLEAGADGVIVGSAIVRRIEQNLTDVNAMSEAVRSFAASLKQATRGIRATES
jgi:tryptophan synthase alpha chain